MRQGKGVVSTPRCVVTGTENRSARPNGVKRGALVEQLETRASVPSPASLTYATMDVATAIATYAKEWRAGVGSHGRVLARERSTARRVL